MACKIRDAARYGDEKAYNESKEALDKREKSPTNQYIEWKKAFMQSARETIEGAQKKNRPTDQA